MNIKVVVAAHKKYRMPDNEMYLPIQVGKALNKHDLYQGDNSGQNISFKNPNYCELTAMYWAWKNLDSEYIGLVHYRRHFCDLNHFSMFRQGSFDQILSEEKANWLLNRYDAILPVKRHYYIETLRSHYDHTHELKDLLQTRSVIKRLKPAYLASFDRIMNNRSGHMFNMFIMKKNLFDNYCEWLFTILFQLEREIDVTDYTPYQARVYGYISELLLDVWLDKNPINYVEIPVMFMENQSWIRKILKFIVNKFTPQKEEESPSFEHDKSKKVNAIKLR